MNNKIKYSVLGLLLVTMLTYWNNEIYEHRVHMGNAKALYAEGKFGESLDELKKANQFPFHLKTQKYISIMESKKRNDLYHMKTKEAEEIKELTEYKHWVESTVFTYTTLAFESPNKELTHSELKGIFSNLNFNAQEKKITMSEDLMSLHNTLISYLNENQIAYSQWESGENLKAEKTRLKAIRLHTKFVMDFNEISKEVCGESLELAKHYY